MESVAKKIEFDGQEYRMTQELAQAIFAVEVAKARKDVREGNVISNEEFKKKYKEKFGLK